MSIYKLWGFPGLLKSGILLLVEFHEVIFVLSIIKFPLEIIEYAILLEESESILSKRVFIPLIFNVPFSSIKILDLNTHSFLLTFQEYHLLLKKLLMVRISTAPLQTTIVFVMFSYLKQISSSFRELFPFITLFSNSELLVN